MSDVEEVVSLGPTPPGGAAPSWRAAIRAGAFLDAAAGLAAGMAATTDGFLHFVAFFAAISIGSAVTGATLVPGWMWATGRFSAAPLLVRLVVAGAFLGAGAVVGFFLGATLILLPVCFFPAAAIVGLGAAAADRCDWRRGPEAPSVVRVRVHVFGALAGVTVTLAGAALIAVATDQPPGWPGPAWLYGPVLGMITLPAASLLHRWLMARELGRRGVAPPDADTLARRAAVGCAALFAIGVAVAVVQHYRLLGS